MLFVISGDPVALEIAATLARPGGNFTASLPLSRSPGVELLKQAIPPLRTLVALSNTIIRASPLSGGPPAAAQSWAC